MLEEMNIVHYLADAFIFSSFNPLTSLFIDRLTFCCRVGEVLAGVCIIDDVNILVYSLARNGSNGLSGVIF